MTDSMLHTDWLPIGLPSDLPTLRSMLIAEEKFGENGDDIKGPIRRKIERMEKAEAGK